MATDVAQFVIVIVIVIIVIIVGIVIVIVIAGTICYCYYYYYYYYCWDCKNYMLLIIILLLITLNIIMATSKDTIKRVLSLKPNWAIVGLSSNQDRPAYYVSKFLVDKGYHIYPVHPKAESVHGFKGYASLSDIIATGVTIDVVDIFVNSNLAGGNHLIIINFLCNIFLLNLYRSCR